MKFIFKYLRNKIREVDRELEEVKREVPYTTPVNSLKRSSESIDSDCTRFTLYKADGGFVIETRSYDRNHDSSTKLYLITEDQNFGDRLAHILTYEALKR